jgi:FMN phosphatase YigB (HAD superfamily)
MPTVHSYDVFDTVITRRIGDPDAVIDIVAERLAGDIGLPVPAPVFAAARKRQERRLNQLAGHHVSLRQVYAEVAATLSADPASAELWARTEEQVDRELTVPVPGGARLVAESRAAGHPVVFVSDTPHSEEFVRELLVGHGVAQDGDRVFTSSARGVTKSKGGLFTAVAAEVGSTDGYLHRGDHQRSDLAAARVEGWQSGQVADAKLTRYERALEKHSDATAGLTSWLAGSSRVARLEAYDRGVPRAVADVAAGVMAPMLVGYTLWALGQARMRGLRRLYFVARDGEIMLEVARRLGPVVAPHVELRYLYGSRQPWVLGACASSDVVLRHWAQGRTDFTARTTLERVGVTPEQAFTLTGFAGAGPGRADTPLSAAERTELASLIQSEPLLSVVREQAGGFAERTTAYLRQEGLLDGTRAALVDAGWSGRAAAGLDALLVAAGGTPVPHFFVGLLGGKGEDELRSNLQLVPWLFDRQRHPGTPVGIHDPNVLVEMLCAGTSGRTIDYSVGSDGRVEPVLDRPTNEAALAWGLEEIQRTALRAAELAAPYLDSEVATSLDLTGPVSDVLRAFWSQPTRAEVDSWGQFPGEEEIWPPFMPLAQRITSTSMLRRRLRGETSMRPNNTWRAGTAVASSQPWRGLLQAKAWREENRDRLRRIPRRFKLEIQQRKKG